MFQLNYVGEKSVVKVNKITVKRTLAKCPQSKGCAK